MCILVSGFVYIWALTAPNRGNMVKLHSSNKCTSLVRSIAWMGKNLITWVLTFKFLIAGVLIGKAVWDYGM